MATDELTAVLNRENIALKAALEEAVRNVESWHAVSTWNILHGRVEVIDLVLAKMADRENRV